MVNNMQILYNEISEDNNLSTSESNPLDNDPSLLEEDNDQVMNLQQYIQNVREKIKEYGKQNQVTEAMVNKSIDGVDRIIKMFIESKTDLKVENIYGLNILISEICKDLLTRIDQSTAQSFANRLSNIGNGMDTIIQNFKEERERIQREMISTVDKEKALNSYAKTKQYSAYNNSRGAKQSTIEDSN